MNDKPTTSTLAHQLGALLLSRQWRCTVAESCTGGLLAAAITDLAGCSQWFDRGFITYSNQAKQQMLGVAWEIIASQGAVSEATARAMAEGALTASDAHLSVAITGIAGPDGGTADKPVGTVWFAWARHSYPTEARCHHFTGNRATIRQQAVCVALEGCILHASTV